MRRAGRKAGACAPAGTGALGEFSMSADVVETEDPSKVAEQSVRVVWLVDSTLFDHCRCACCGGLRHVDQQFIAPRAESAHPGS
jgi:hypothetical protein